MPDKKSKRVSMRGMGADAFFNPPAEAEEESTTQVEKPPVPQTDSIPVVQQASETASHSPALPVTQQDSTLVEQLTSTPIYQYTNIPASQEDGTPVDQQASVPEKQLMKATYYITPEQDMKLETIRLARRRRGERVDKSALIREAIDKLLE
jgi:hypothetical protein